MSRIVLCSLLGILCLFLLAGHSSASISFRVLKVSNATKLNLIVNNEVLLKDWAYSGLTSYITLLGTATDSIYNIQWVPAGSSTPILSSKLKLEDKGCSEYTIVAPDLKPTAPQVIFTDNCEKRPAVSYPIAVGIGSNESNIHSSWPQSAWLCALSLHQSIAWSTSPWRCLEEQHKGDSSKQRCLWISHRLCQALCWSICGLCFGSRHFISSLPRSMDCPFLQSSGLQWVLCWPEGFYSAAPHWQWWLMRFKVSREDIPFHKLKQITNESKSKSNALLAL